MGNYLGERDHVRIVMAASNQTVGVDHVTVVPENFDPEGSSGEGDDQSADR
ncbi:hypothetical protein GRX03_04385 [Halovenus sp. WSH3]|uniref:Uncharacterized protein n=1 Tax=Halovenus carboxidivorans TaxID=2692199 RepID=A0A6B0SZ05_9EURY|nr:hypothetical protein [Halovenus carboxidivorans]MXR50844.1 hypothetical protein [Halovenus carboxidivorans]